MQIIILGLYSGGAANAVRYLALDSQQYARDFYGGRQVAIPLALLQRILKTAPQIRLRTVIQDVTG